MRHLSESDVVVTTCRAPSPDVEARGVALARRLRRPFIDRRHDSIAAVARRDAAAAAVVVSDHGLQLVHRGRVYAFHPNMARQRVEALRAGRPDRLVDLARLRPGDRVLDCTCGLGADAIVAAHAVGATGRVVALESSAMLAAIIRDGMARYVHADPMLVRAIRRVRVRNRSYDHLLPTLPADSWDVVYFDPMFAAPIGSTRNLDLVRMLAGYGPPTHAVIAHARRVARRSVVVKDRAPGPLLRVLGIPVVSRTQRTWYGRLEAGPGPAPA